MDYYYHPLSSNCRKTTALIDHLGVDADRHLVDLASGEQLSPSYLALNPNGKVPVLVDGDFRIWESNAIAVYLAEKTASDLWPSRDTARIDVLRWMFWEQGHLMYACGIVTFEKLIKPMIGEGGPDEARVRQALGNFRRLARVLDDHLGSGPYLVEGRLTLADWAVAGNLSFAEGAELPMTEFGNVGDWLARLDQTPAWRSSAPRMPS